MRMLFNAKICSIVVVSSILIISVSFILLTRHSGGSHFITWPVIDRKEEAAGHLALLKQNYRPDYGTKNPLYLDQDRYYGVWKAKVPSSARVGEPIQISLECTYEGAICPFQYFILLQGPTSVSFPPTPKHINETHINYSHAIKDPGLYNVYIWPEYRDCHQTVPKIDVHYHEQTVWNKAFVQGSPFSIQITGPAPLDLHDECTDPAAAQDGRWIATDAINRYSRHVGEWYDTYIPYSSTTAVYEGEVPLYIYQPYGCKHKRFSSSSVHPKMDHVLFLGDSTMRQSFCAKVWPAFHEGNRTGDCYFAKEVNWVGYHYSNKKFVTHQHSGKDTKLSFLFLHENPDKKYQDIINLKPEPTHIVLNVGLWMETFSLEEYKEKITEFLKFMYTTYPHAEYIWRTTTSSAQPVFCFADAGRELFMEQSRISKEIISQFQKYQMKISIVDAWDLTNSRPDTSFDGRHFCVEGWETEMSVKQLRPHIGEGELGVLSWIFDEFRRRYRLELQGESW